MLAACVNGGPNFGRSVVGSVQDFLPSATPHWKKVLYIRNPYNISGTDFYWDGQEKKNLHFILGSKRVFESMKQLTVNGRGSTVQTVSGRGNACNMYQTPPVAMLLAT